MELPLSRTGRTRPVTVTDQAYPWQVGSQLRPTGVVVFATLGDPGHHPFGDVRSLPPFVEPADEVSRSPPDFEAEPCREPIGLLGR